jgi:hypothetical protein
MHLRILLVIGALAVIGGGALAVVLAMRWGSNDWSAILADEAAAGLTDELDALRRKPDPEFNDLFRRTHALASGPLYVNQLEAVRSVTGRRQLHELTPEPVRQAIAAGVDHFQGRSFIDNALPRIGTAINGLSETRQLARFQEDVIALADEERLGQEILRGLAISDAMDRRTIIGQLVRISVDAIILGGALSRSEELADVAEKQDIIEYLQARLAVRDAELRTSMVGEYALMRDFVNTESGYLKRKPNGLKGSGFNHLLEIRTGRREAMAVYRILLDATDAERSPEERAKSTQALQDRLALAEDRKEWGMPADKIISRWILDPKYFVEKWKWNEVTIKTTLHFLGAGPLPEDPWTGSPLRQTRAEGRLIGLQQAEGRRYLRLSNIPVTTDLDDLLVRADENQRPVRNIVNGVDRPEPLPIQRAEPPRDTTSPGLARP